MVRLAGRATGRPAGAAVVYHQVVSVRRDPLREVVPAIPLPAFERALTHLRRRYEVVPLASLLDAVAARRRGHPFPVAITFDDDSTEHIRNALPVLTAMSLPATFFLTGAFLSGDGESWWARLQRALDQGVGLTDVAALMPGDSLSAGSEIGVRALVQAIEDLDPAERASVRTDLGRLVGPSDEPELRAEDVRKMVAGGSNIGFHTLRHDPLTRLDDDQIRTAMREGRGELEQVAGAPIRALAYPHGAADGRVAALAREAGYELGLTTMPRAVTPETDPLLLGRLDGAAPSPGAFAYRVARTLSD
jgi:peptidoglycan/xylan/chitin deacetylase (PgdA/CDA1 family)